MPPQLDRRLCAGAAVGARAYAPGLGQFTTQDSVAGAPSDPLTLNQYIYSGDSPIDNADTSGNRFACAGTCTAEESVVYNEIYDAGQASNAGDDAAAGAYEAQAVTWIVRAAAGPSLKLEEAPAPPSRAALLSACAGSYREGCGLESQYLERIDPPCNNATCMEKACLKTAR